MLYSGLLAWAWTTANIWPIEASMENTHPFIITFSNKPVNHWGLFHPKNRPENTETTVTWALPGDTLRNSNAHRLGEKKIPLQEFVCLNAFWEIPLFDLNTFDLYSPCQSGWRVIPRTTQHILAWQCLLQPSTRCDVVAKLGQRLVTYLTQSVLPHAYNALNALAPI